MQQRIAACFALIAFAACLIVGGMEAGNPFSTTVLRALLAMAGSYVIGLIVGWMGQRIVDENVKLEEEKLRNSQTKVELDDR